MSQLNPEVYIRRNKLRRIFENKFNDINKVIKSECKSLNIPHYHVKYSSHVLDRAIQREIDEQYVFDLFEKLPAHSQEVVQFLGMIPLPDVEEEILKDVEYRPLRLEITDGNLWLGMTVDRARPGFPPSLTCRMAFINNKRLQGKISTKVINL